MPEKAKAVIVIGLRDQENEVELVQERGYKLILLRAYVTLEDAIKADYPLELDLNDEEGSIAAVVRLSEKFDIRAVYNLNEYRVPLASRMADVLGFSKVLPYEAALNCRNKKRTRQMLKEHGVGSAQFAVVRSPDEALEALDRIPLPVMIKPSNDAGSNFVTRCDTEEEILYAMAAIQKNGTNLIGQTIDPDILLEEYLEGSEFSVEAVTDNGETTILAITAKRITAPPRTVEIGHLIPAPLAESDRLAIHQLVVDALAALGVDHTVSHTEVKLTPAGPRIVEVNARPGGDKIPVLVRAVTGYDLRELALHLALGESFANVPRHEIRAPSASIRFLAADHPGIASLDDTRDFESLPGVETVHIEVADGQLVEQTTNNNTRLGYFIVYGDHEQRADTRAEELVARFPVCIKQAVAQPSCC